MFGRLCSQNLCQLLWQVSFVFLHGGPGGGTSAQDRIYFDPAIYKILPTASIEENTTWDLVADIERLRAKLGVDKWVVFGGSWGSTLAPAYGHSHPEAHIDIPLSGIFTLRKSELDFLYQEGTSQLFPEEWDAYIAPIPEAERGDMAVLSVVPIWPFVRMATSRLHVDQGSLQRVEKDDWAVAFAAIENHYFINEGFMRQGQLLEKQPIDKMSVVNSSHPLNRPPLPVKSAYDLKKAWPEITLDFTHAGHSAHEPEMEKLLVEGRLAFP
ncbi:hypothetical protein BS47DRAFT_1428036 [Hydnum rufescens UP504]|uniref:AB hydrolase-1 domain-containing protein n=1 Tax=Hydnum rufescens UP504 TaxID=1448309 RepID=A0A9P6DM26_9AGAM|nr:hypothetical protein BS47DRAFT_1428036 [Hydnum rufescens UP504]